MRLKLILTVITLKILEIGAGLAALAYVPLGVGLALCRLFPSTTWDSATLLIDAGCAAIWIVGLFISIIAFGLSVVAFFVFRDALIPANIRWAKRILGMGEFS